MKISAFLLICQMNLVKVKRSTSWKTVDAIVHNAGFLVETLLKLTQEDYESVYKVNVLLLLITSYLSALFAKKVMWLP
jgi:NADP-dependent 3-hydroxy acid dehydrogenase YdfG